MTNSPRDAISHTLPMLDVETLMGAITLGRAPSVALPKPLQDLVITSPRPELTALTLLSQAVKHSPHRWPLPTQLEPVADRPILALPTAPPTVVAKVQRLNKGHDGLGLWLGLLAARGYSYPLYDLKQIRALETVPAMYWPLITWVRAQNDDNKDLPLVETMALDQLIAVWDHLLPSERDKALKSNIGRDPLVALSLLKSEFTNFGKNAKRQALIGLRAWMSAEADRAWLEEIVSTAKTKPALHGAQCALNYLGVGPGFEDRVKTLKEQLTVSKTLIIAKGLEVTNPKDKDAVKALSEAIHDLPLSVQARTMGLRVKQYRDYLLKLLNKTTLIKSVPAIVDSIESAVQMHINVQTATSPVAAAINGDVDPNTIVDQWKKNVPNPALLTRTWARMGSMGERPGEKRFVDRAFKTISTMMPDANSAGGRACVLDSRTEPALVLLAALVNPDGAQRLIDHLRPYARDMGVLRIIELCETNIALPVRTSTTENTSLP